MLEMTKATEIFVDSMAEHTASAAAKERIEFEEAFTLHHRTVFRAARSVVRDPGLAEDVTQEVFMMLMRRTALYDEERGSLKAFLLGITRNYVLRKLKQERPFVSIESAANEPAMFEHGDGNSLIDRQSLREMYRAILSLPSHYREVVVLCELQELSYAEAAAVLDCAIGTIRSRLHRARTMLTERLNSSREDQATVKDIKSERCFA